MIKTHGYLLPAGDAFTDELSCALVFYPKKDEYRRALLGAITHFEKWLAWELDDDKRGVDAARAWALANACTLECWDMACIDELLETMESVRVLLENRKDCCDDNVTYGLQDEVETDIDPGVGDPPDYYGETAISDWNDWEEHVCYNAHLYVDNLKNMAAQMNGAVEQNSLYLGLIAAGLTLLTFSGIGIPVAYLLASFVVTGLVLAATAATFADSAQDIEDARMSIVCALLEGGDLAGTVEDALGSGAAWDLFYQYVDYDSATSIIHEGGAEGEYLPAETRSGCDCEEVDELIPDAWMTSEDSDWTAGEEYNWESEDAGRFRPYEQVYPVDYPSMYSGPFVYPYAAPTNDSVLKIRALRRATHAGAWYVRIRNYSTEEIVFTGSIIFGSGSDLPETLTYGSPVTLVKGVEYYAQVKIHADNGYAQWVSGVSLKPEVA